MNLLGLDIATTTGWAIWNGSETLCGILKPNEKRPGHLKRSEVDPAYEGRVAAGFADALKQIIIKHRVDRIGIEQPLRSDIRNKKAVVDQNTRFAGGAVTFEDAGGTSFGTMFRLYSLQSAALVLAARYDIPVLWANQTSWRKLFVGMGRAPKGIKNGKSWMKERARERCEELGVEVSLLDAAEACGVLWWLRHELNPETDQGPLFAQE